MGPTTPLLFHVLFPLPSVLPGSLHLFYPGLPPFFFFPPYAFAAHSLSLSSLPFSLSSMASPLQHSLSEQPPHPDDHQPPTTPELQPHPSPDPLPHSSPDDPPLQPEPKLEPLHELDLLPLPPPIDIGPLTVTVSSTSAHHIPNSNPDTPLSDPPMGVPILLATASQPSSSSRRLPPPCWTPDETAALIDAYRDKWYALRRGNLRAAHWQEVADEIHSRCPDVTPPKTAIQCRHKMEKLRKRYRAELLRAKSIPHHRFSSSWLYFSKMDTMEKGGNNNNNQVVSLSSPAAMTPPVSSAIVATAPPIDVFDEDDGDEDDDNDEDFSLRSYRQPRSAFYQQRNGLRIRIAGNNNSSSKQRSGGSYGGDFDDSPPNPNPNYGFKGNYSHKSGSNSFDTPPPHYNGTSTRSMKSNYGNYSFSNSSGSAGMGTGMSYMNMSSGAGVINKKKRKMMNGMGKRDREEERESLREKGEEAAMEMVEAIRMLGEGFVRMEKMKMEMMRETERMRMEMEMKRTEMLLESQQRIVEAFAKGWTDVISSENNNDQDNAAS